MKVAPRISGSACPPILTAVVGWYLIDHGTSESAGRVPTYMHAKNPVIHCAQLKTNSYLHTCMQRTRSFMVYSSRPIATYHMHPDPKCDQDFPLIFFLVGNEASSYPDTPVEFSTPPPDRYLWKKGYLPAVRGVVSCLWLTDSSLVGCLATLFF